VNRKSKLIVIIVSFSFLILACGTSSGANNSNNSQLEPTPIPETAEPTPIPPPTDVPAPAYSSGDLVYETDFSDIDDWDFLPLGSPEDYVIESRWDGVFIEVPLAYDRVIGYYSGYPTITDVHLTSEVELVGGTNYSYLTLFCRYSDAGRYEFILDAGGYWLVEKYDVHLDEFTILDRGASTSIRAGKKANNVDVVCNGDKLTFTINDEEVSSVEDRQFSDGLVGVGLITIDNPLSQATFHNFQIFIP
jgi:hypothetical protein